MRNFYTSSLHTKGLSFLSNCISIQHQKESLYLRYTDHASIITKSSKILLAIRFFSTTWEAAKKHHILPPPSEAVGHLACHTPYFLAIVSDWRSDTVSSLHSEFVRIALIQSHSPLLFFHEDWNQLLSKQMDCQKQEFQHGV